jgi:aminopeptidase N
MRRSFFIVILTFLSVSVFAQQNQLLIEKSNRDHPQNHSKIGFSGYKQSALLNKYDVNFYFLNITLQRNSTYIQGDVTINSLVSATSLDTFALELIDELSVDSVFVNGISRSFTHNNDQIFIPIPLASQGSALSVKVFYHGDPATGGGFFSGISTDTSPSWGNDVTWTLSEPFNANQWWPCKQVLTDKADSSWVFITTNSENKAGSNGMLTATVNVGGGLTRYEWKSRNPIDYYLISASVAQYVEYNIWAHPAGTSDSLLVQNYIYNNPATLNNFKTDIDLTPSFIELYSNLFGLYPFMNEKYGHCMAPMGGGMEHQTMTTLGFFDFYLICHELAHMWFGDHVTCATWSDIFINEGFASYSEYLAAEYLDSHTEAQNHMLEVHNNVMSAPDGSIYIPVSETNDENRIFDGRLSYDKGSAVIHMLRFEMQNDSLFFASLKKFQNDFANSTATGDDLKNTAEAVSGLDLTDFFNQWYYGQGYPTYSIVWNQTADSLIFISTQSTSTTITPLFKMLMEIKVTYNGGDTVLQWYQTANMQRISFPFNKQVQTLNLDPDNWVLDGTPTISASTEEIPLSGNLSIAPNPCQNSLSVNFSEDPDASARLEIRDLTGRILMQLPALKHQDLDVSMLKSGIYLLILRSEQNTRTYKFIRS